MNAPLRRISLVAGIMFVVLMVASSLTQVVFAGDLKADGRNVRVLYQEYGRDRGPIVVAGESKALSDPVKDNFKYQRKYTNGPLYAAVTGYFPVYGIPTGLEAIENSILNGTSESFFLQRLQDLVTGKQPSGGSVELTINPKVQQAAMTALGKNKGAAVAINPMTGAILAMVSTPTFDPNDLATHNQKKFTDTFKKLNEDPSKPLVNRAIRGDLYPPGSTFKLITAAAALESGKYTADSVLDAPTALAIPQTSSKLHNYGNEVCSATGKMTMAAGMTMSCNTLFGALGLKLGEDAIREQAEKFGFNSTVDIPLRTTASVFPENLDPPQVAYSSIGQYDVRVTPMQMAMVAAAIANGGVEMKPYLVQTVRSPDLSIVSTAQPEVYANPISKQTADALKAMMVDVVKSGTGKAAQIPGVQVAGKTGTAELSGNVAPHTWFVAFAPSENPEIAVAVIVENGGNMGNEATGGAVAAPIARAMIEAAIK